MEMGHREEWEAVARVSNLVVSPGSGTIARSDQRQVGEPRAASVDSV